MNAPISKARSDRSGFTLIELLVVLVLMSILTAVAAPSMTAYVDRSKTRRALDRLVTDVTYARILSIQQGRRTSLAVNANGTYTISLLADDGTWTTVKSVDLRTEYAGIAVSGGLTSMQFTSRGTLESAAASDGFIKVARGTLRDSIFVSPAGRVYRAF